jgi:uncharacterized membrane protein
MSRFALPFFILALIVGAVLIGATTDQLPSRLASHFDARGTANGWMSRSSYLLFMLVFAVVIPTGVVAGMSLLPRLSDRAINLPDRDYWLAPARREETFRFLTAHACWLGSLMVILAVALHFMLIAVNAAQPPRLSTPAFLALLAAFLTAMVFWMATLWRRFRRAR